MTKNVNEEDEKKLRIMLAMTYLSVELVITQIQGSIDGLEGLKVNIDLLFLSLSSNNCTTVNHKTVVRDARIQLEPLLCGGNGSKH